MIKKISKMKKLLIILVLLLQTIFLVDIIYANNQCEGNSCIIKFNLNEEFELTQNQTVIIQDLNNLPIKLVNYYESQLNEEEWDEEDKWRLDLIKDSSCEACGTKLNCLCLINVELEANGQTIGRVLGYDATEIYNSTAKLKFIKYENGKGTFKVITPESSKVITKLNEVFSLERGQYALIQDYKNMKITYYFYHPCGVDYYETKSNCQPEIDIKVSSDNGLLDGYIKVGRAKEFFGATISFISHETGIATLKVSTDKTAASINTKTNQKFDLISGESAYIEDLDLKIIHSYTEKSELEDGTFIKKAWISSTTCPNSIEIKLGKSKNIPNATIHFLDSSEEISTFMVTKCEGNCSNAECFREDIKTGVKEMSIKNEVKPTGFFRNLWVWIKSFF